MQPPRRQRETIHRLHRFSQINFLCDNLCNLWILTTLCLLAVRLPARAADPTYSANVQPILAKRCVGCHNAQAQANAAISGGLALDSYAALRKGIVGPDGKAKSVLTPGKPEQSEFFARITAKDA